MQVMYRAAALAGITGCTPSYLNLEAELDRIPPEQQMQAARSGTWGQSLIDFLKVMEAWRAKGDLQGIVVQS